MKFTFFVQCSGRKRDNSASVKNPNINQTSFMAGGGYVLLDFKQLLGVEVHDFIGINLRINLCQSHRKERYGGKYFRKLIKFSNKAFLKA